VDPAQAAPSGTAYVHDVSAVALDLEIDGLRTRVRIAADGDRRWIHLGTRTIVLHEVGRFPRAEREQVAGSYVAPMPGRVGDVLGAEGDQVSGGQVLVVLEAMKMEHRIQCTADGVVREVRVAAGRQVEADQVLLVVG